VRLRDTGNPRGQVMEKPMEKLVQHALLPFRNKVWFATRPVAIEAGTYSAPSPEASGRRRRHFRQIYNLSRC
jgi:hypothetical protein